MTARHRITFLGLHDLERDAISACLRSLASREPSYELTPLLDDSDWVIADADHRPSVQLVLAAERLGCTLFVGATRPAGAVAFIARPVDPKLLLRELDALVAEPGGASSQPVYSGAAERRRSTAPSPAVAAPEPPARTALLVDDSEIALRFLESRLQRWSLVMDRALSSGRAIELLAQRSYDFVFLDVELGAGSELDGLALCQHIKRPQGKAAVKSAVILVSAHNTELDRARGSLAGCDAYLGKPLDEVELQRLMLRQGLKVRALP